MHVDVDTGFFSEDLVVNGDSRIPQWEWDWNILTVGNSSLTLDGNNGGGFIPMILLKEQDSGFTLAAGIS